MRDFYCISTSAAPARVKQAENAKVEALLVSNQELQTTYINSRTPNNVQS